MISHIRASVLATALMFSSALVGSAFAQDALSLPDLSPEDIASDVQRDFNNRTGTTEFIAPTFDPFEQDSSMAGSVSLRSVGAPVTTIDGDVYNDGVMLDMAFYYNSPSDDPFDGRGFTDAAFLSGSLAPAVRRDRRILECSRNVRDVVYDHSYYYRPTLHLSFFRPYRHYGGHYRFGRFDRPYWRNRGISHGSYGGWGRASFPRSRGYNSNTRRDDRARNNNDRRDDRSRDRSDRDRDTDRSRDQRRSYPRGTSVVRSDRRGRMGTTVDNRQPRAENRSEDNTTRNRDNRRSDTRRNEARSAETNRNERRSERRETRQDRGITSRVRDIAVSTRDNRGQANIQQARENRSTPRATPRAESRPTPRRNEVRTETRSAPRAEPRSQPRSEPRSQPRSQPRAEPTRSNRSSGSKRSSRSSGTIKSTSPSSNRSIRQLNFFPKRSSFSREVVRSVDVDCAREETLSVFIPRERLEAARFDGLTILALDNKGQEYPIFVPPNYIEGFNLATGGGFTSSTRVLTVVNPTYDYEAPIYRAPVQSTRIEAQCPTGTTKQNDGTCLLTSGTYPQ